MMNEKEYVISKFKELFGSHGRKIALYGLGANTKILLEAFGAGAQIIALMDEIKTGERVWNLPVVTTEEACAMGVELIVIVARSSNVPIIYRRIAADCQRLGIPVYDIGGRSFPEESRGSFLADFYRKQDKALLREKIDHCDVASFDIFDTLLVRRVLQPEDIFIRLEEKARAEGIIGRDSDFAKSRQRAERELSLVGCPSLENIYELMCSWGGLNARQSELLQDMEIREELRGLMARDVMVEMLQYARRQGKLVCCTSDMYLSEEVLRGFLRSIGVEGMDAIFVSCTWGISKTGGLFHKLRQKYGNRKILHIGDSEEADQGAALRQGIDDVFLLRRASDMLADSCVSHILEFSQSYANRKLIGSLAAVQFNNPFLFKHTEGKLEIKSFYTLGYDFLEPLMAKFLAWLLEEARGDGIDTLLLGARDGWLLREMLDVQSAYGEVPFDYQYIPASRTTCIMAGLKDEEDVWQAASLPFNGGAEELLRKRFLLESGELLPRGTENDRSYVMSHASIILRRALDCRESYCRKLREQEIGSGKKAYFDFVSSGTCQFWLEKIMQEKLQGYYFARFLVPGREGMDIKPFLTAVFPAQVEAGDSLLSNYFLIESFISAPEPYLLRILPDGTSSYDEEHRSGVHLEAMRQIHLGILDAFRQRLRFGEKADFSKELADCLTGFLREKHALFAMQEFKEFLLTDEFCQRQFRLGCMLGE